jgi:hypothetical protein
MTFDRLYLSTDRQDYLVPLHRDYDSLTG